MSRHACFAATIFLAACTSTTDTGEVRVTVDLEQPAAEVDERYLSLAVDTAQVLGGVFWNPVTGPDEPVEVPVDPFDFDNPRVRALAAALAPSIVRIGGTAADFAYYDLSDDPLDEPPEPYTILLTKDRWNEVVEFTRAIGADLVFALNAGPGPRDDLVWQDDQARALLELAAAQQDPVILWELGNEINLYPFTQGGGVSPEQYAADLQKARTLIEEVTPGIPLAGPSSFFFPIEGELLTFLPSLMPIAGQLLDVVTWHHYPQQSERCIFFTRPAGPEVMLDPDNLDEVGMLGAQVESLAAEHAPGAQVWLGEIGNSQCGGAPGVSDRFAGTLWWVDLLGLIAKRGQQVVIRQTLTGSDYGLLDDVTFEPYPDYWASLLWKRLMGPTVLDAQVADLRTVRAWAHCSNQTEGGVALIVSNLGDEPQSVDLGIGGQAEVYTLTAESLTSAQIELNGTTLELGEDDALPDVLAMGTSVSPSFIDLPPLSASFVHIPEADASACRP